MLKFLAYIDLGKPGLPQLYYWRLNLRREHDLLVKEQVLLPFTCPFTFWTFWLGHLAVVWISVIGEVIISQVASRLQPPGDRTWVPKLIIILPIQLLERLLVNWAHQIFTLIVILAIRFLKIIDPLVCLLDQPCNILDTLVGVFQGHLYFIVWLFGINGYEVLKLLKLILKFVELVDVDHLWDVLLILFLQKVIVGNAFQFVQSLMGLKLELVSIVRVLLSTHVFIKNNTVQFGSGVLLKVGFCYETGDGWCYPVVEVVVQYFLDHGGQMSFNCCYLGFSVVKTLQRLADWYPMQLDAWQHLLLDSFAHFFNLKVTWVDLLPWRFSRRSCRFLKVLR